MRIKIYSNQFISKYNEIYHLNDEPVVGSSSQTSPFSHSVKAYQVNDITWKLDRVLFNFSLWIYIMHLLWRRKWKIHIKVEQTAASNVAKGWTQYWPTNHNTYNRNSSPFPNLGDIKLHIQCVCMSSVNQYPYHFVPWRMVGSALWHLD